MGWIVCASVPPGARSVIVVVVAVVVAVVIAIIIVVTVSVIIIAANVVIVQRAWEVTLHQGEAQSACLLSCYALTLHVNNFCPITTAENDH